MAELVFRDVEARLGDRTALSHVSFALGPGAFVALIGPNGAGKSTLLRAAVGLLRPSAGQVSLGGADPARMDPTQRARWLAYLPQARPLAWPLPARDVVALGRFAYGAGPSRLGPEDSAAVDRALAACALEALAERPVDRLSGGEAARVHVARALATEAPLILADEPIAALDPLHAFRVMDALAGFCAKGGAVLAALHDLTLAAQYAHRILALKEGRLIADGDPAEALTPALIEELYGVAARVETDKEGVRVRLERQGRSSFGGSSEQG